MLRNLKSPETYFQAAFRVQSPWSIHNPDGDDPKRELVKKPICFVFDFAPTRAPRQLSVHGIGLSPGAPDPETAVRDLVSFLAVLAYDGANMTPHTAGRLPHRPRPEQRHTGEAVCRTVRTHGSSFTDK